MIAYIEAMSKMTPVQWEYLFYRTYGWRVCFRGGGCE